MEKSCQLSVLRFGTALYTLSSQDTWRCCEAQKALPHHCAKKKMEIGRTSMCAFVRRENLCAGGPRTPVNTGPKAVRGFCRGAVGRRRGCRRCRGERVRG